MARLRRGAAPVWFVKRGAHGSREMMVEDLMRCLERGRELLSRIAPLLCLASILWLGLNGLTKGLLIGPALVGLFAIVLRAHEGKPVDLGHAFRAFDDITVPLLAGFVFWAPFAAVEALPDAPFFLSLILLPWFALSMPLFFVLADRPGLRPTELSRAVQDIALGESGSDGNRDALGLHVLLGSTVLLLLGLMCHLLGWLTSWPTVSRFLVLIIGGPVATCVLASWYAARALPSSADGGSEAEAPSETVGSEDPPTADDDEDRSESVPDSPAD